MNNPANSVSVEAMADEVARRRDMLAQAAAAMRAESAGLRAARTEVEARTQERAALFATHTVTGLDDPQIETLDGIGRAAGILPDQGLGLYRDDILRARADALAAVNRVLPQTVDVAGFNDALAAADTAQAQAARAQQDACAAQAAAAEALRAWEATSLEDDIVRLDRALQASGAPGLNEARAMFEPGNRLGAAWKWAVGGAEYRRVRTLLEAYGHGRDGRDAFADLGSFRRKYDDMHAAVAQADQRILDADADMARAKESRAILAPHAASICDDAELLDDVRGKLAADMQAAGDFAKALADHFLEDFPRDILPMLAKKILWDRMDDALDAQAQAVEEELGRVTTQHTKLAAVRGTTRLKGDITTLRAQHDEEGRRNDAMAQSAARLWRAVRDHADGTPDGTPQALATAMAAALWTGPADDRLLGAPQVPPPVPPGPAPRP